MGSTWVNTNLPRGTELARFGYDLIDASVIDRPNRFVVIAGAGGEEVRCHIHDPGRLKELIFPGNSIKIRRTPGNRTAYSVLCALDGKEWVVTDSRFHSQIARKFLPETVRPEVKVGGRRIDFLSGNEYIEVKGCTLMVGDVAKFPDAPSVRASHHVKLLTDLREQGHESSIMILVMRKEAKCFMPNDETDPAFSDAMKRAHSRDVNIIPLKMHFDGSSMVYDGKIGLCPQWLDQC